MGALLVSLRRVAFRNHLLSSLAAQSLGPGTANLPDQQQPVGPRVAQPQINFLLEPALPRGLQQSGAGCGTRIAKEHARCGGRLLSGSRLHRFVSPVN